MSDSLLETNFYVDTRNSELSLMRLDKEAVYKDEESLESMVATARRIGASTSIVMELINLIEGQAKERELSYNELETLEGILEGTGLERLGVIANRHGIQFGNSKHRGDGTVPQKTLRELVAAFTSVFAVMKENSFADLTFNGVVALKELGSNNEIALHVRDSKISVQRATVVWESIPDLDFSEVPKAEDAPKPKEAPKPKQPRGARPGPFQQCWD